MARTLETAAVLGTNKYLGIGKMGHHYMRMVSPEIEVIINPTEVQISISKQLVKLMLNKRLNGSLGC